MWVRWPKPGYWSRWPCFGFISLLSKAWAGTLLLACCAGKARTNQGSLLSFSGDGDFAAGLSYVQEHGERGLPANLLFDGVAKPICLGNPFGGIEKYFTRVLSFGN